MSGRHCRDRSDSRERRRRHHHKRRDRSRSRSLGRHSSSPSRSRSISPAGRRERESLRKEREKEKLELKKKKELMKALETPEEKRARRIAKKEAKERRKREKMGWDQEYQGYTNADNPFGDEHLLDTFVWQKKREVEASKMQLSDKEVEVREKRRQEEMKRELEKVKKRRIEREKEREYREEEMTLLQRMKEADMFKEWEAQEDSFHLDQAKMRSKIRIESGRAKPIDLLAKYVNTSEDDMDIEVQEPYHLLRGLNMLDLEDLLEDIKVYSDLEDSNLHFWKDITIICEDELRKLRRLELEEKGSGAERREGINTAVSSDVAAVLKGKTHGQLKALEEQVNQKLRSAAAGTDTGYWESLLQQLKAHMARARLRDKHQAVLRKKLFQLKQEQADQFGISGTPLFPSASGEGGKGGGEEVGEEEEEVEEGEGEKPGPSEPGPSEPGPSEPGPSEPAPHESDVLIAEEDLLKQAYEDYETGNYEPKLMKLSEVDKDVEESLVLDFEQDISIRAAQLERILSGATTVHEDPKELEMMRSVAEDGQAEEEYNFNSEVALEQMTLIWKDKYRPRKPRFFNRVHTGFEWNKYNQTHYDTDNPPPKIVQGYKFNIFYPDLIDKRKTPTYTVIPCDGDGDFAILRFHAGPPYEDIGFKVVNREWEYSWKHGFKSQFNNNILQLWFRFKRNRYRR